LDQDVNVDAYLVTIKSELELRLQTIYNGLITLKNKGFDVDAIAPQAAIYLTVQFNLKGKTTPEGKLLSSTADITSYLLEESKLAIVPFYAFGASTDSTWYRLSVGTCPTEEIETMLNRLENSLSRLK
jgi:aspartate aminotransferase